MKLIIRFWIGIAVLIILSPLGLMLPEHFKAGSAWGEWRLEKFSSFWKAPIPDYNLKGWEGKGLPYLSFAYIISALIGIIIIVIVVLIIGRLLVKKGD